MRVPALREGVGQVGQTGQRAQQRHRARLLREFFDSPRLERLVVGEDRSGGRDCLEQEVDQAVARIRQAVAEESVLGERTASLLLNPNGGLERHLRVRPEAVIWRHDGVVRFEVQVRDRIDELVEEHLYRLLVDDRLAEARRLDGADGSFVGDAGQIGVDLIDALDAAVE